MTDRMSVAILWIALVLSIVLNIAQNRQLAEAGDVTMLMLDTNDKLGESFDELWRLNYDCQLTLKEAIGYD